MPHAASTVFRRRWPPGWCSRSCSPASWRPERAQAGPAPVRLGAADSFAVLAGGTVTNAGPTVVNGDLGGAVVAGFPPGRVNGARHVRDAAAQRAASDLATAYDDAAGRLPSATLPSELGGRTLTRGVHRAGALAPVGLGGRLTLDAQGDPRAAFILQIPRRSSRRPGAPSRS